MAKKYYGIILANGSKKVCNDWDEAKDFIATCPSCAKYKGFPTEKAAQEFAGITGDEAPAPQKTQTAPVEAYVQKTACSQEAQTRVSRQAIAYTDGSYNSDTGEWGYGVVITDAADQNVRFEFSGKGTVFNDTRNVAGEVYGAIRAIKEAIELGYTSLKIYHDYAGVENWATGAWKAKNDLTRGYVSYVRSVTPFEIELSFEHVYGHTGVDGNEEVDLLAKRACGMA